MRTETQLKIQQSANYSNKMKKSGVNKKTNQVVTLSEWALTHTPEELEDVFLGLDAAMKFIHEHNYCVADFRPSKIEILNNSSKYVRFKHLREIGTNPSEIINEDIFSSAYIQIVLYLKFDGLNVDVLKENFDKISNFLPKNLATYYKQVILYNNYIYLSDFITNYNVAEANKIARQLGIENLQNINNENINNKKELNEDINKLIYKKIMTGKNLAFIDFLFYPVIILAISIIIAFVIRIINI